MKGSSALRCGALVTLLALGCASNGLEDRGWGESVREWTRGTREALDAGIERESLARVKPWERDLLARPDMAFDPDPLRSARRNHIFFSKEAALVGGGVGGGGCGCN